MFDMRSYIVSLIAVFMALGIGILLGTVIVDNGILADQQNVFLKKIAAQMNDLRAEKAETAKQLDIANQFMPEAASYLMRDRLTGKRIVIFCTANSAEQTRKIIVDNIKAAGGEAILYVINITDLSDSEVKVKEALKDLYEIDEVTDSQLEAIVVQNFAEDIAAWQDLSRLVALTDNGWLSISGSFADPPTAAVLIGESKPENKKLFANLHAPIIKAMKKKSIPIVGVETYAGEISNVADFNKAGVNATIDDIDLIPGQVALAYALAGEYGSFGVKQGAQNLIPELKPMATASENTQAAD